MENSGGLSEPQAKLNTKPQASRVRDQHQHQHHEATITNPATNKHVPLNVHQTSSSRANMPSVNVISPMPDQQYSYPPLDAMGVMHDTQPYNLPEQRDFHQLADERNYEHEHLQEAPPRYPSPPPGPADPYHIHAAQMVSDLQSAMEAAPKSDSGGPESPGRSKPIPKPDRPVTKDDNGRYFCDWPGCTEVIKDFNRKCEWS